MTTKWFYEAQRQANEHLYSLYKNCPCNWQVVTKDRVIELYQCSNPEDKEWTLIQIVITKNHNSQVSIHIQKVEYVAAWVVRKDSVLQ